MNLFKLVYSTIPLAVVIVELMLIRRTMGAEFCRERRVGTLAVLAVIAAARYVGFDWLGGSSLYPAFPYPVIAVWSWMNGVILFALPLGFAGAVVGVVLKLIRRGREAWGEQIMWTVIAIAMVISAWGAWEAMRVPAVVERKLVFKDLPKSFEGYRIVQLSDLHLSSASRPGKLLGIVEKVNAEKPDLVAITGDLVNGRVERCREMAEPLRNIVAKDGVFACTGNHECFWNFAEWEKQYAEWNVNFLRDTWTGIRRGDDVLAVGGMDDYLLGADPGSVFRDAPENAFRVMLFHRPVWQKPPRGVPGVRLQLSGHTHGGVLPFLAAFVARRNDGQVRGLYRRGDMYLNDSPGCGQWAGFPFRFRNPTEISVLVLTRGEELAN